MNVMLKGDIFKVSVVLLTLIMHKPCPHPSTSQLHFNTYEGLAH